MNNYWDKFYKQEKMPTTPSPFAKWFVKSIKTFNIEVDTIADIGCGNGRDLKYFKKKFNAIGIDKSADTDIKTDVSNIDLDSNVNVYYSRFFLHSISNKKIIELIKKLKNGWFVAEFRVKGDKPVIYNNHKRNFIKTDWLIKEMLSLGYEIVFLQTSRGLARYKNEDPLVCRLITYK